VLGFYKIIENVQKTGLITENREYA